MIVIGGNALFVGFLFIVLISGVVGVVGIYYLRQITKADRELYTFNTVPLASIGACPKR